MTETKPKPKAPPKAPEPLQFSVQGETNGLVLTIEGDEYELDAQDALALKKAIDQAVVGLTF